MFAHRLATEGDIDALRTLIALSIATNQAPFLSPEQVRASRAVMGLDTQLIADRTYFVVDFDGRLVGCGGWSYRNGIYGGDHSTTLRNAAPLDPAVDPARIRAMYTHPDFVRRGIGRLILELCETAAAAAAGFRSTVLMGTLSGEPLYLTAGYRTVGRQIDVVDGIGIPLVQMRKDLS